MKKSFIYLNLFLINSFISPLHAENMLTKVRDYFYTTRLFAGYHSSPAEKAAAKEKLEQLSEERDNLQNSLVTTDNEQEKQAIHAKTAEINKQIDQQKIILGEKMTGTRKLVWLGTGLLGLAALGGTELWLKGTQSYVFKYGLPTKIQTELLLRKYSDIAAKSRFIKKISEIDEKIEKINEKYTAANSPEEYQKLDRQINALTNELEELTAVGIARGYTEEEMRKK